MLTVQLAKDGALELNWMWLPTFIGQNYPVMRELEKVWRSQFAGKLKLNEEGLREAHEFTLKWLCDKFKINGLGEYLRAIENVRPS